MKLLLFSLVLLGVALLDVVQANCCNTCDVPPGVIPQGTCRWVPCNRGGRWGPCKRETFEDHLKKREAEARGCSRVCSMTASWGCKEICTRAEAESFDICSCTSAGNRGGCERCNADGCTPVPACPGKREAGCTQVCSLQSPWGCKQICNRESTEEIVEKRETKSEEPMDHIVYADDYYPYNSTNATSYYKKRETAEECTCKKADRLGFIVCESCNGGNCVEVRSCPQKREVVEKRETEDLEYSCDCPEHTVTKCMECGHKDHPDCRMVDKCSNAKREIVEKREAEGCALVCQAHGCDLLPRGCTPSKRDAERLDRDVCTCTGYDGGDRGTCVRCNRSGCKSVPFCNGRKREATNVPDDLPYYETEPVAMA